VKYCRNLYSSKFTKISPEVYQKYINGEKKAILCKNGGIKGIGIRFHHKIISNLE
jgi:hypothetical protein